jgi:probable rRNA maturation factor
VKGGATSLSRLRLSITAEIGRPFVPFVRQHLRAAYMVLSKDRLVRRAIIPLEELSVVLVGDRRMSALHEEFLGIAGPTDVLTFPLESDARGRVTAGEVIVCVPEARRQARTRRMEPRLEVLLYSLHGMLHLLGYDDRTDRAFRIMHRTEDAILTKLGFGPVFAARSATGGGR